MPISFSPDDSRDTPSPPAGAKVTPPAPPGKVGGPGARGEGAGGNYAFPPMHADYGCTACFAPDTFTIAVSSGANGSVMPPGTSTVADGC